MDENHFLRLINRHTDDDSCLFLTASTRIIRVHCPFRVLCVQDTGEHSKGEVCVVRKVRSALDQSVLYEIGRNVYAHSAFRLVAIQELDSDK